MHKTLFIFIFSLVFLCLRVESAEAIEDPGNAPNNKVGIHILFPVELNEAARLVNSNGGDWGYVTIPIQAIDKDSVKWQEFFDEAERLHLIPLVRIATENYFFNTKVWRKPTEEDVLDFANFLNSLTWPTKNKYIIVFNETNRADEWGGSASPEEYAKILSYAVSAFKSKDSDFFIISGGLDNAAATNGTVSIDSYEYLRRMNLAVPGIFYQIDGLGSHSYPNPAFAKPPQQEDQESVATFRFERQLIESMGGKDLPVFITETGWSSERVAPSVVSQYYSYTFEHIWNDPKVIAITPFILSAGAGPFIPFSFLDGGGNPNQNYKAIEKLPKIAGNPKMEEVAKKKKQVLSETTVKKFDNTPQKEKSNSIPQSWKTLFKWVLKL